MASRKRPKSEDATPASAPSVRIFSDWTPARIKSAERQCEYGDLSTAVSICDWLLTDDKVASGLDARMNALLALTPSFEPSGDRRRSNRAVKALEAGEDWWTAYPKAQLALMHKWGLLLGLAPLRHGWKEFADHGNRLLPMPLFWTPSTMRRDENAPNPIWKLRDRQGREHDVVPGDGSWILHTPFGQERGWAYGLWRSLSLWVLLKHWARADSGAAGEKGSTTVVTTDAAVGRAYTKEVRQELAKALLASAADRIAILAAGQEMKLLEMSAATGLFYKGQVEMADAAISIRIRGGNLTSQVKEGSRAAAETQHAANEEPMLAFDAECLAETLNAQSLNWWAEFNFGDPALAPWPVWPVEPEEDKAEQAGAMDTLGDALTKFDKLGFDIDPKGVIEKFGLEDVFTGRSRPTQVDPAPVLPGADPKTKTPAPKPKARGAFVAALASGAPISENRGFVAGQLYVDDVVDSATAAANAALEPTIEAIGRVIGEAESFEEMRTNLKALLPHLSADELNEVCYRGMQLGELAGRRAATQDG